jgi:hypothetical protein
MVCLRAEEALEQAPDDATKKMNMIYLRILGYLVHHVPTDRGLKVVITEIVSCKTDSALFEVGKLYYNHYLRACTFPNLLLKLPSDDAVLS